MPSKSRSQHNFMELIAHDSAAAHHLQVPQGVGKDFIAADVGKKVSRLPMKVSTKATHGYGR